MRAEIIKLREKIDTTFIYVTHDQVEAMTLGDRIVIMRDGFIQQIGTPQEVFNHPANLFVAGFIGTPQMNFFDATLAKKGDKYVATVQGKDFELPADKQEALKKMDKIPTDIIAGVRPVHVHLSDDGIDATVDVSELMGSELHLHVNSNGKDVVIVVPTTDIDVGAVHGGHKPVKYSFRPELMHFFDKAKAFDDCVCVYHSIFSRKTQTRVLRKLIREQRDNFRCSTPSMSSDSSLQTHEHNAKAKRSIWTPSSEKTLKSGHTY